MSMPARQESDRTSAPSVTKSLTLNSTRSGVGTGNFGGYGMTNGAEKPSVLHMIMEALGLRNQAQNREPTSKDIGTLISE